ncbi:deoxynucleoside triphosphate triphosphohydrolase SAMHD1-like [Penaeus monodon]|uniref:deoxynucleoside triphosphate triphosphohydrolase SAMHD1-like n=1 Tax=Penaeus monodon TaxID=6687 RepID=UPI0018A7134A|nr:deoxynucleoside triphosphate triphosphohydrolase SAMHD1-like [Penaeus monodon]
MANHGEVLEAEQETETVNNKPDEEEVTEKVFNDAVHGAISLHPLCVKVVDTPQFQRLRFLKQVGTAYFVYPAAAHNRFEHSLGVCHLAGLLVRALQSRQPSLGITKKDVLCVQLAGLCHDLGHGPFSHLWECFVKEAKPEKGWTHEEASVKMFDYLIERNNLEDEFKRYKLDNRDIIFIKELIRRPFKTSSGDWPYKGRPREKAFLYEIVSNKRSGIDVDKWDYIVRDGHTLGIKVTFDYLRLIKFSRVIDVEGEGPQICMRDKECVNLYDMFHARRILHRTAYQHRVTKTVDTMFIDAFLYADKHVKYRGDDGKKYCLSDACDNMSAYTLLNDSVIHLILLAEGEHPDLLKAKQIVENVLTRKLYIYVGHTQPTANDISHEDLLHSLEKNIPKGSSLTLDKLDIQEVRLNYGMGSQNPIEHVRFYSKSAPNIAKVLRKEEVSAMLPQSFQEVLFRLVCKSFEENIFLEVQNTFLAACKELQMKEPSVCTTKMDSWPSHLTPVKRNASNNGQQTANGTGPSIRSAVTNLTFENL